VRLPSSLVLETLFRNVVFGSTNFEASRAVSQAKNQAAATTDGSRRTRICDAHQAAL